MRKQYISYSEAVAFLQDAAKKYPEFISVESIGKSYEKRDIYLATLSFNVKEAHKKPALLYTGTIHAREWIGIELAIAFIKYYLEHKEYDPRIEALFSKAAMYIVPCLNPDGFEYSRNHFSFWRKNRRVNADGTIGVDLNRNFNVGWQKSKNTSSNVYGGSQAFSESETQAIRDFVLNHKNITIALDYHSQGNVFFPAHNFKHEDTIDTTDMNVLCANMAYEIYKVSGRKYGIDQGKPPANLIGGSGREFYYSQGILATVVEVGTRNISDYEDDMSEHISEHIPALLSALEEAPNYKKDNPLKRVANFQIERVEAKEVALSWEYESSDDIYFEIYRNKKDKQACVERSLIATTKANLFCDTTVEPSTNYFYYIRAVDKKTGLKSAFAPRIELRTKVDRDEFSKILYALQNETGYLSNKSTKNRSHFGKNSLFVGVSQSKGICESIISFSLHTTPDNAIVKRSTFYMYPINRVGVKIEKFGEWNVGLIRDNLDSIYEFDEVSHAKIKDIGRAVPSNELTQGIWQEWEMSEYQAKYLEKDIDKNRVRFRAFGPHHLKIGRDSQMMQWDLGYGKFGYGLNFRPKLDIVYTTPPIELKLVPYNVKSLSKDEIFDKEIVSGFDKSGNKVYSYLEFDLSLLPAKENHIITLAYVKLLLKELKSKENIRFHIHMIEPLKQVTLESIKKATIIEKIGYDKSVIDIKEVEDLEFIFDTYSLEQLEGHWDKKIAFIIIPTYHKQVTKNALVSWKYKKHGSSSNLILNYIKKRREPLGEVSNLKLSKVNGKIKLTWTNPKDKDFRGVYVVKNPFRVPRNPYDGQKLYAGCDEYTFDTYGALDIAKYYAVFTYDNVPNFSKGIFIKYDEK